MKLSVIVPVYDVEDYLDRCVQSVLTQDWKNFELILVDDQSPDRCPQMCDAWAEKDARVRVIHKKRNQGLGFARNTGMENATGQYILFLDSDDWMEPGAFRDLAPEMEQGTDVVVFGTANRHENRTGRTTWTEFLIPEAMEENTPAGRVQVFAMLSNRRIFPFAWNKLYRREFLQENGFLFEQTKLIEDFVFNIAVFEKAQKIKVLDRQYHNYCKPAHETLVSKYAPEFFALSKRKYLLERAFLNHCNGLTEDNRDLINQNYVNHIVASVLKNRSAKAGLTVKQQKEELHIMLSDKLTVQVLSEYRPDSFSYRLLSNAMAQGKTGRVYRYCIAINVLLNRLIPALGRMKQMGSR